MEEMEQFHSNLMFVNYDGDEEVWNSSIFSELKHYCLQLLDLLQHPNKDSSSTLYQLQHFLRQSQTDALQPFFEYTLFPLLLLFDAAVECRSLSHVDSVERSVTKTLYRVSDIVAEGVLQCLEELLKKCQLRSLDQMVVLLKKLTYGALLSPSEAAEEFREGVIRCFRALLLSLRMCSDKSCSCKKINGWPALVKRSDFQSSLPGVSRYNSESECSLAFLQSQTASAAVGHWLSLLLKAADTEAVRGHRGSAKLRVEAFVTLRMLVAKVGTADALSFFAPGVVSQFGKVLHVSKTMITGAAGSAETLDQAIRGLAEFLMIVLEDDASLSSLDEFVDGISRIYLNKEKSSQSVLEELRHLPLKTPDQNKILIRDSRNEVVDGRTSRVGFEEKGSNSDSMMRSLHVDRTKDWIEKTSAHVDKLLSATFPHLCVHPAKRVRHGLLAAVRGLLSKNCYTLKESRLMLLECLCVLVCDDSEEVSRAAQVFLRYLLSSSGKHYIMHDIAEIFNRLIDKLPKVVLGSEEALAISHAQKLLVVIYFSGPQLVKNHLLQSPVTAARFLDAFSLCLGQNSAFGGSLQKLILARPSSTGYLHSITEMKAVNCFSNDNQPIMEADQSKDSKFLGTPNKKILSPLENVQNEYELPRIPPWFAYIGSHKLYQTLAGILRLVGLSVVAGSRSEVPLSVIVDIPLGYLRKLVSEVRMRDCSKESLISWYHRTGSGQLVRQASTAACILNEMIFGLSDQAVDGFDKIFHNSGLRWGEKGGYDAGDEDNFHHKLGHDMADEYVWKICRETDGRSQLIDCIGSILHEYLSHEVWDLPCELRSPIQQSECEAGNITQHFFHDNAMLHQVIIDGIGIFNICLGVDFSSSGFLHSSLYVLLENLICSNFQIRSASDGVLHVISATSGYPTVGHLVIANADYIIDSICRQLRHLDLNPHVPSVLAAMLSYIGVAHKLLPLLEEPMHSVSLELEILGRRQHPDLTVPFLKAVAEIAKASKHEACSLHSQAESYSKLVKSKFSIFEKEERFSSECSKSTYGYDINMGPLESEGGASSKYGDVPLEQVESTLFNLNDSKRYRHTVGSIVGSCLTAVTPLIVSEMPAACLVALDIVEDCIIALAKVEEAYRHEKETKEVIEEIIQLCSLHSLQDILDSDEDGTKENRLLPAMNKIWPFFVSCVRSKNLLAIRRCLAVISSSVQISGGDFFSRRFHTDGPHFWKLLNTSPFQKKPISKEERIPLQLPYRSTSKSSEESVAEVSDLKVQAAVLNMVADLSRNKRSASALDAVLKKVSGIVVGIACSGVTGLHEASVNALAGLATIDPDLVWLLLADVYYSLTKNETPSPPLADLPEVSQMLPPASPKGYLYVQYGGQSYGFNIDKSSVEIVFKKLHLQVFNSQLLS